MHLLEKKLITSGVIDTAIKELKISDWFDEVEIVFNNNIVCKLGNCFDISLKHDKSYDKGKTTDGDPNYQYFIQDITIIENGEFYIFQISGWPLEGEITCKKIEII